MILCDMLPEDEWSPPSLSSSPLRKEPVDFSSNSSRARSVMFEIKKFSFFPSSPQRVRDRVYAVLSDMGQIERQRVIDEHESWFRYEITVEIVFKQASYGHRFMNLIERTGASIDVI